MSATIAHIVFDSLAVAPATEWHFLRITDADGFLGHGEASLGSHAQALADCARAILPTLLNREAKASPTATCLPAGNLPQAAIRSAVDMALREIEAMRVSKSLAETLAPTPANTVQFYANINRRSHARTPQSFAASADAAIGQGFEIVKIAPFDEITPELSRDQPLEPLMTKARARIEAVLDAIGDKGKLRIDCHWRFGANAAKAMIDAMAEYRPDWIECPIVETQQAASTIAELRRAAARHGIQLAGLETGTMVASFAPFLAAGSYDVIMPDVKYIGGLDELTNLATLAAKAGTALSLHNPTGPVAHAVSVQAAAALAPNIVHELQFDETPMFAALVASSNAPPIGPRVQLNRNVFGSGLGLSETIVESLRLAERSFVFGERR